jgi:hypothetical protein
MDEREHRRTSTRTLPHRPGEASVRASHAPLDPSVLVKQRHYQPRDGRRTEMTDSAVLDSAGRRRSPAILPGFHAGRAPPNKGMLYPADPPTVEEIVCVMRHASEDPHGFRLRAMSQRSSARCSSTVRSAVGSAYAGSIVAALDVVRALAARRSS